jgi:hypothetical protein
VEKLGAESRAEGIEALAQSAFELVRPNGWEATPLR